MHAALRGPHRHLVVRSIGSALYPRVRALIPAALRVRAKSASIDAVGRVVGMFLEDSVERSLRVLHSPDDLLAWVAEACTVLADSLPDGCDASTAAASSCPTPTASSSVTQGATRLGTPSGRSFVDEQIPEIQKLEYRTVLEVGAAPAGLATGSGPPAPPVTASGLSLAAQDSSPAARPPTDSVCSATPRFKVRDVRDALRAHDVSGVFHDDTPSDEYDSYADPLYQWLDLTRPSVSRIADYIREDIMFHIASTDYSDPAVIAAISSLASALWTLTNSGSPSSSTSQQPAVRPARPSASPDSSSAAAAAEAVPTRLKTRQPEKARQTRQPGKARQTPISSAALAACARSAPSRVPGAAVGGDGGGKQGTAVPLDGTAVPLDAPQASAQAKQDAVSSTSTTEASRSSHASASTPLDVQHLSTPCNSLDDLDHCSSCGVATNELAMCCSTRSWFCNGRDSSAQDATCIVRYLASTGHNSISLHPRSKRGLQLAQLVGQTTLQCSVTSNTDIFRLGGALRNTRELLVIEEKAARSTCPGYRWHSFVIRTDGIPTALAGWLLECSHVGISLAAQVGARRRYQLDQPMVAPVEYDDAVEYYRTFSRLVNMLAAYDEQQSNSKSRQIAGM